MKKSKKIVILAVAVYLLVGVGFIALRKIKASA